MVWSSLHTASIIPLRLHCTQVHPAAADGGDDDSGDDGDDDDADDDNSDGDGYVGDAVAHDEDRCERSWSHK